MGRTSKDLKSEITRAKEETEHWRLACLVLRHHNNELMMECGEVKKRFEEGFKERREISEKHDDSNVIVYKRKKHTNIMGNDQRRKCQQCVKLNWEIDDLTYEKERADGEIEGLKNECLEWEVQGDLVKIRCNQLKEKIAILEKETCERENAEQERITCLEKEYKNMESYQKGRCVQLNREVEDLKLGKKRDAVEIEDLRMKFMELESQVTVSSNHEIELGKELEDYKIKCQGLSAELKLKKRELENLLVVTNGFDHEREDYRTKSIGMEEQIKGLIEEGIVMSQREKSAGERICHLEEVIKKMETDERERYTELETQLLKVEEENSALRGLQKEISCEKTCREMGGSDVANVAHLTRTETSPHATFTPSCKPSSLQVNSDGVHVSESPLVNNQSESAKNKGTSCLVEIDSEDEIVDISDNEGERYL
ncbi:hypothetical protein MKX01_032339 [Papaver californicum]|nr:hypothetical protein MKX01_032339 [Papaver californicum]